MRAKKGREKKDERRSEIRSDREEGERKKARVRGQGKEGGGREEEMERGF